MFLFHRPSSDDVNRVLAASRDLPLSYDPVGLARQNPEGFSLDEQTTIVGVGGGAFVRATAALSEWKHFDLGWVELFPKGAAIEPGTVVVVSVRHLGFWSLNGCRVVYSLGLEDDGVFGFAYGTLTNHAECGEEIFQVGFQPETGEVTYRIRAVSSPRATLAKIGYPFARSIQARFRRDSARALSRAIAR